MAASGGGRGGAEFELAARRLHRVALVAAAEHDALLLEAFRLLCAAREAGAAARPALLLRPLHAAVQQTSLAAAFGWASSPSTAGGAATDAAAALVEADKQLLLLAQRRFVERGAPVLDDVDDALREREPHRVALGLETIGAMAAHICADEVVAAAARAQHVATAPTAASDPAAARAAVDALRRQFDRVVAWTRSVGEPAPPAAERVASRMDGIARKAASTAVDAVLDAAAARDVGRLCGAAAALKQMALCFGPSLDLVAAAAHKLEAAALAQPAAAALARVGPLVDAATHAAATLLRDGGSRTPAASCLVPAARDGRRDRGDGGGSPAFELGGGGASLFVHLASCDDATAADAAAADAAAAAALAAADADPISHECAAGAFGGDDAAMARAWRGLLALLPSWSHNVERALADGNVLALRSEAYALATVGALVGARRLAAALRELLHACDAQAALPTLCKLATLARAELKLLVSFLAQRRPLFLENGTNGNGAAHHHNNHPPPPRRGARPRRRRAAASRPPPSAAARRRGRPSGARSRAAARRPSGRARCRWSTASRRRRSASSSTRRATSPARATTASTRRASPSAARSSRRRRSSSSSCGCRRRLAPTRRRPRAAAEAASRSTERRASGGAYLSPAFPPADAPLLD